MNCPECNCTGFVKKHGKFKLKSGRVEYDNVDYVERCSLYRKYFKTLIQSIDDAPIDAPDICGAATERHMEAQDRKKDDKGKRRKL